MRIQEHQAMIIHRHLLEGIVVSRHDERREFHAIGKISDMHDPDGILKHSSALFDAQFSPNGKWVAAKDADTILHVWETDTEKRIADIEIIPKPEDPVLFTFSPNGECLLTASFDTATAQLWETRTGARLAELTGQEAEIRTLHFSPDGKRVVIGNIFAPARIYVTNLCGSLKDLLALAESRVPGELTSAERQKYLAASQSR